MTRSRRGMHEKSKLYRRMRKRRQSSSQKASRIVDSRQVKSREVTELKEWTQIKSGNWREYNKKTGREGVGGWWEAHKKQSSRITAAAKKIRMNFPLDKEKRAQLNHFNLISYSFSSLLLLQSESQPERRVESHSQENYFLLLFFLYSFSDAATSVVEEEYKIC